jgi:two-component system, LytTR family, sensor kinase
MKISINKERIEIYVWIGLAFLGMWIFSEAIKNTDSFLVRALNNVWRFAYILVVNFVLFEYAVPFITRKRESILYNVVAAMPVLFVFMMLYSWGLYGWRLLGIALHIYTPLTTFKSTVHGVTQQMTYSMMSVFFFGIVKHIYDYIKLKQAAQQLRIEKQQAELSYLKSQTNPHFLFNTLNNIYSLSRDKSDLAPESILRLSKILRFMLYETSGEYISIEQELRIIDDYIALEKLRYDESLRVNLNHDIEDMKQAIPPLLLIPLVENAFKHGVSETRGNPFVDIHLSIKQRQLTFVVKNSSEGYTINEPVKENIGLSNLRRQLQLLYADYDLSVQQDTSVFTATLQIKLASHV